MTRLADHLASRNETQTAFAARAGLSDATLSRVIAGKIPPSTDVIEKVYAATEGEVTANDLFGTWRAAKAGNGDAAAKTREVAVVPDAPFPEAPCPAAGPAKAAA